MISKDALDGVVMVITMRRDPVPMAENLNRLEVRPMVGMHWIEASIQPSGQRRSMTCSHHATFRSIHQ